MGGEGKREEEGGKEEGRTVSRGFVDRQEDYYCQYASISVSERASEETELRDRKEETEEKDRKRTGEENKKEKEKTNALVSEHSTSRYAANMMTDVGRASAHPLYIPLGGIPSGCEVRLAKL